MPRFRFSSECISYHHERYRISTSMDVKMSNIDIWGRPCLERRRRQRFSDFLSPASAPCWFCQFDFGERAALRQGKHSRNFSSTCESANSTAIRIEMSAHSPNCVRA
jgi:hypothetical protein